MPGNGDKRLRIADCGLRIERPAKKRVRGSAPTVSLNPQFAIRNPQLPRGPAARFALLALALLAVGCATAPPSQPVRLRPLPGVDAPAAAPMFHIRMVTLSHRMRPDAPVEDIWRLLGTTNVPYEKRTLWETNDLRLGDGARLAAERMNQLATETPDRAAHVQVLFVRENFDFAIPAGGERDTVDILWTDAAGRMAGRHFDRAITQFRCVCRSDPEDPAALHLALMPEVAYGPEEMRWVQVGNSVTQKMLRATFPLTDLAAEVRLVPGRLLVIGGRIPGTGKGAADLSLGGVFFHGRRGPDTWSETIILTAERTRPGQVPESGTIPFMPNLKPQLPAKPGAAPTTPPAAGTQPPGKVPPATTTQPPGKAPAAGVPASPPAQPPSAGPAAPGIPGVRIIPPGGTQPLPPK